VCERERPNGIGERGVRKLFLIIRKQICGGFISLRRRKDCDALIKNEKMIFYEKEQVTL